MNEREALLAGELFSLYKTGREELNALQQTLMDLDILESVGIKEADIRVLNPESIFYYKIKEEGNTTSYIYERVPADDIEEACIVVALNPDIRKRLGAIALVQGGCTEIELLITSFIYEGIKQQEKYIIEDAKKNNIHLIKPKEPTND